MEQKIKINNAATRCTIDIEGTIGVSEAEQFSATSSSIATYDRLREALEEIAQIEAKDVVVNIRSVGGDVGDALLIYEALAGLDAQVTTICYGYTASAATIIAQAASTACRKIASSALYLIHQSSTYVAGNANDIEQQAELLRKTDARIAAIYASHGKGDEKSYAELMQCNGGNGRWLSPDEALQQGLVDEIVAQPTERSLIGNIVGHVAAWLGIPLPAAAAGHAEPPQSDMPNMHHLPQRSVIAFEEGQIGVQPTVVAEREDSHIGNIELTQNQIAYSTDVRALKRSGR